MINKIIRRIKLVLFRKKWRKHNRHNSTYAKNYFQMCEAEIGCFTYGGINILNEVEGRKVHIGNLCSIAEDVLLLLGDDHYTNLLSTFPFKARVMKEVPAEATSKGDIYIADDVWIGKNVIILSGVKIGQGAVIAAGSIVTKDIPPYAIAGGVPAKPLKFRFDNKIIEFLLSLDYNSLNVRLIQKYINELYTSIDDKSLEEVKELLSWFPKK